MMSVDCRFSAYAVCVVYSGSSNFCIFGSLYILNPLGIVTNVAVKCTNAGDECGTSLENIKPKMERVSYEPLLQMSEMDRNY